MIYAVTGHRPERTGGYSAFAHNRLVTLAKSEIESLPDVERILTGMALGWDQAVAAACVELGVPFVACVPCDGQERLWPTASREFYQRLLGAAVEIVNVNPGPYAAWKMKARNVYMVDNAGSLLALWSGEDGGTAHCVRYAESVGRPVINCWTRFRR